MAHPEVVEDYLGTGLSGVLRVEVMFAEDLKRLDVVGHGRPYCSLKIGPSPTNLVPAGRTKVAHGATPKWDYTFIIDIKNASFIQFKLKDEDYISKDETYGKHILNLHRVTGENTHTFCLTLTPKGKLTVAIGFSPVAS